MLTKVHLENFKLHEELDLGVRKITVLIGPNNSGKSSVFQALLSLRQAAEKGSGKLFEPAQRQPTSEVQPYLFPPNQILEIGEFRDAVRRRQDVIRLGVVGKLSQDDPFYPGLPVEVSFAMDVRNNVLTLHKGEIQCGHGLLKWLWLASYTQPAESSLSARNGITLQFKTADNLRLIRSSGFVLPSGVPVETVDPQWARISEAIATSPLRLMQAVHPVYPLRGFEESGYPLPKDRPGNLARLTLRDRALAIVGALAYDRKAREESSQRLEELIQIKINVGPVPGFGVKMWVTTTEAGDEETLLTNEGTGASQLPFILIPVALARRGETIFLSEPEVHLHPALQAKLTERLLAIAEKQNLQLVIETHSEHALHKLLHAVAKGDLPKDDLAIYYFENQQGTANPAVGS
ncbi:MAG: AAA family ATPase [Terriglobia bacterium]